MINYNMKINNYIFEYEIQSNKINFKLNHNIHFVFHFLNCCMSFMIHLRLIFFLIHLINILKIK